MRIAALFFCLLLPATALCQRGTIEGTVTLSKPPPAAETAPIKQDKKVCGDTARDERYVVGEGGVLAGAVVFLDDVGRATDKPEGVTLDQQGCRFVPHVLTARKGAKLTITSSDRVLHNTHAYLGDRTLFNVAIPVKGMKLSKKLKKTGIVRVECDVHNWMSAWIFVTDHGFAVVTGEDGRFELAGVPPGRYTLKVWHEAAGETQATVEVKADKATNQDFSL